MSEDKPKKVAFVDIGHSAIQTSVCEFYKGRLKVKKISIFDLLSIVQESLYACMLKNEKQQKSWKYFLQFAQNLYFFFIKMIIKVVMIWNE